MKIFRKIAVTAILLFLAGNIAAVAWRWARPYLMHDAFAGSPRVFLWAWERPESLEFLNPKEAGVAVLAKTLILNPTGVVMRPRLQPIELPSGIETIAVVRIEPHSNAFAENVKDEAVQQILELATRSASGIQIDFDARVSERSFYRALLEDLRRKMPKNKALSITALASWCIYDDWISELPVDESVPMLFRLGADSLQVQQYFASGNDFRAAKTRLSIGLSMDELPGKTFSGRRIYMFNPKPWTRESVTKALRYARELR
jgi:hypothetical protein